MAKARWKRRKQINRVRKNEARWNGNLTIYQRLIRAFDKASPLPSRYRTEPWSPQNNSAILGGIATIPYEGIALSFNRAVQEATEAFRAGFESLRSASAAARSETGLGLFSKQFSSPAQPLACHGCSLYLDDVVPLLDVPTDNQQIVRCAVHPFGPEGDSCDDYEP